MKTEEFLRRSLAYGRTDMKTRVDINEYHLHHKEPSRRQFELFDLAEYLKVNREQSAKPHSHSYYQLIWFYSDKGNHFVDFNTHEIRKNRIFFIAKNQVHYFEKRADYKGVLLHFNESFLLQNERDIEFFINYNLFNNLERPYFELPPELIPGLNIYVNQIKSEVEKVSSFGHDAILTNMLKSLLITIEREKRKELKVEASQVFSSSLANFRKLLESNYRSNWLVSQYASELNMSVKTLNNLIKSVTGKTVSKIISDRIVLEAKRQLCHSSALVSEVGFDLGFQDPSYFVKFFKKHVALTPSEFRKSIS